MCYSNSSTSKNSDLAKKYGKQIPKGMDETPVFFASGFSYPTWRIVTKDSSIENMNWGLIFQNYLRSWRVNLGWGFDGCARWRKVTITVAVKYRLGIFVKRI